MTSQNASTLTDGWMRVPEKCRSSHTSPLVGGPALVSAPRSPQPKQRWYWLQSLRNIRSALRRATWLRRFRRSLCAPDMELGSQSLFERSNRWPDDPLTRTQEQSAGSPCEDAPLYRKPADLSNPVFCRIISSAWRERKLGASRIAVPTAEMARTCPRRKRP